MNERSSVHGEDDRTCRPSLYAKSVLPAHAIESLEPSRGGISPYWRCTKAQMPLELPAPGSDAERDDLLAFLKTLTDDAFIAAPSL
jgi:hypothetical protein